MHSALLEQVADLDSLLRPRMGPGASQYARDIPHFPVSLAKPLARKPRTGIGLAEETSGTRARRFDRQDGLSDSDGLESLMLQPVECVQGSL